MTLFSDKNNNHTTIVFPDPSTDVTSSRMHYLHPEYIDEKSKSIYSQSRCPLSMLAETCKNIGKPVIENSIPQCQEPSVSISPSCSSSCSAPKFSPHSTDYSPTEQLKMMEDVVKDKSVKEKPRKRKALKKEPEVMVKRPQLDPQLLHSNYAISEFLKFNNLPRESFVKPDQNNLVNPIYNQLLNQNVASQFNHSTLWKSKLPQNSRIQFPINYLPQSYPSPNIPMQNGLYRCAPPPNLIPDFNQFYGQCPMDKPMCDCPACINKKIANDKYFTKLEPILFNFLQGIRKDRPINNSSASAIKYCMYCGQCIPLIQNLLNHIHTEHIESVNTNLYPKMDSTGNFSSNFNIENLQAKDINPNDLHALKSMDLLKQLQFIYNEYQVDKFNDKPVLMK